MALVLSERLPSSGRELSQAKRCRICGAEGKLEPLHVREMMFGTREAFRYHFCENCGSLQLADIPDDLSPYYPDEYEAHVVRRSTWGRRLRRPLAALRIALVLFTPEVFFRLLCSLPIVGFFMETHPLRALRSVTLGRRSRIVDVGGGKGVMLRGLRALGFRNLTCVDPYLRFSGQRDGIRFMSCTLGDLTESFDVIMYHHALEHVVDLEAELKAARRSLAPGGAVIIRMPTLPNSAYDAYGANWIQIDAPRHIHILSREGMKVAAQRCRLEVVATGDDSTEFQFWGSQEYAADVPLNESRFTTGGRHKVPWRIRRGLVRRARAANAQGRGDEAWFILRPFGRES